MDQVGQGLSVKRRVPLKAIAAVVLTAIIVGGGMFLLMKERENKLNNKITALQSQSSEKVVDSSADTNLRDELIEAKFKLALMDFWGVREAFRDPVNKNLFYYATNFADGSDIWVYDLSKDTTYQKSGQFGIPQGNTLLYSEKLPEGQELSSIGIFDNKFVYSQLDSEISGGPCGSNWFLPNLKYIDTGTLRVSPKPFIMPEDLKKREEESQRECAKQLNLN